MAGKKAIESYDHKGKKRANNPPVGLVTPETDKDAGPRTYAYDPHLDPQLVWAGKAEHTSFEVPTVSLHVHERVDPRTIIKAVRKQNGNPPAEKQLDLFSAPEENPPIREAIEFYKHSHGWTNRLVAGDSLLVMNSLLEKEGMAGKVQMVYFDPPYGIKYGSNFQPFINKRDVKDGKDEDTPTEPEIIHAFRDTWELGIHSYLTYIRDRLLLSRELLSESGSIFIQISIENSHHLKEVADEIFGSSNFVNQIIFQKSSGRVSQGLDSVYDILLWYAKDKASHKFRKVFKERTKDQIDTAYNYVEQDDGSFKMMSKTDLTDNADDPEYMRRFRPSQLYSQTPSESSLFHFEFNEKKYKPSPGAGWRTSMEGIQKLVFANRVMPRGKYLAYKLFADDFPFIQIHNVWTDVLFTSFGTKKQYIVQTSDKVLERCMLMTTDPGDLVFDPTCGSGTTAFVAEQWGRRWITCDTSRVAVTLAKQRLMTSVFDYYKLAHDAEGVGSGFQYKTVPHVTLKSIANNPEIKEGMTRARIDAAIAKYADQEVLYDQPLVDHSKARVTGPFTMEAVPAPTVRPLDGPGMEPAGDASAGRTGETLRQDEWRDELLKCGIRGKGGQHVHFSRVEPLPGTRYLQADAETREEEPKRVVVSFGPIHAPMEQRQVEEAIKEAQRLVPKPKIMVFAAFQFDPEAAKDIDETNWPGMVLLKAQMNTDLLTEDLKKKRASNESFWMIGQPDVELRPIEKGEHKCRLQVEVFGFDYYNPRTGAVESGDTGKIALWMLDTDYDGRSLYPRQVFFPMAGENEGWARLAKSLKAEIDPELMEAYRGTVSLPFEPGEYRRVAVKIVDDRGIESLKILEAR